MNIDKGFIMVSAALLLLLALDSAILILGIAYTHYPYGLPWKKWKKEIKDAIKKRREKIAGKLLRFFGAGGDNRGE